MEMIDIRDWHQLLPLMALAATTGCFAGFMSGILGVGGGIIIVPVLYYIFGLTGFDLDVSLHMAIGTSLATIAMTQLRSVHGHHMRGAVDGYTFSSWGAPLMLGSVAGAMVAGFLHGQILAFIFAFGMLAMVGIMAYRMLFLDASITRFALTSPIRFPVAGVSGVMSTIMGIGGGTFNVMALTMLFGMNIRRAIGTSSGLGVLIGLVGAIGFIWTGWNVSGRLPLSVGYVNLPGVLAIVPFTILFSPLGVRVAHAVQQSTLRVLLMTMMTVAAVHLFYDAITYAG